MPQHRFGILEESIWGLDETTIPRFSHLLEEHDLGGAMLEEVNHHLAEGHQRPRSTCSCLVQLSAVYAILARVLVESV